MRRLTILLATLVLTFAALGAAKQDSARVTVTYVAGDAVYLSAGRLAGVADSAVGYVLDRKDTVVVLKVTATSSKSAVCRILQSKRPPAIGDVVRIPLASTPERGPQPVAAADTSAALAPPAVVKRDTGSAAPAALVLHGRVSAQYATTLQSGPGTNTTRPGIILSLRGTARDLPLSFEIYGNLRSLSYGSGPLFGTGSVNQSRIYSLFVRYDDSTTRVAAGRLTQAPVGSAGAVDGLLVSERFGDLTVGASGGFEPTFSQRSFGSDYRKATVFVSHVLPGSVAGSATAAYTRRYYHSALDRDAASAAISYLPTPDWSITANGDVDLHRKEGSALVPKTDLSNVYATLHYRFSPALAAGAGISAWRPTYSFSTVQAVPDSMLDYTLRTSPTVDLSAQLPSGLSLYNTFSARSSSEGFAKEYSNYTSLNASNLLGEGISARASVMINTTLFAKTKGFGGALQKTFAGLVDVTIRHQHYRYDYSRWAGSNTTNTAGADLLVYALAPVSIWASVERLMSADINTTSVMVDVGWRF